MFGSDVQNPLTGGTLCTNTFGPQSDGTYNTGLSLMPPGYGELTSKTEIPVHAMETGFLITAAVLPEPLGMTLVLYHGDGFSTRYSNLLYSVDNLLIGDEIKKGTPIGYIKPDECLWFEVRKNNSPLDPGGFFTVSYKNDSLTTNRIDIPTIDMPVVDIGGDVFGDDDSGDDLL